MRSVLNESNLFSDLFDYAKEVNKKRKKDNDEAKNKHYLGGSISKYTKNLIMSFPILCDDTLSIDTAQMISRANEKNVVTMLQIMFASMTLTGDNGVEIIKQVHNNMDAKSIDDILDALGDLVESADFSDAELRDAVREMCYQLRTNKKTFPTSSFNEKSVNDYLVHNLGGKMTVMETSYKPRRTYKYEGPKKDEEGEEAANRRAENRDKREEEKRGEERDQFRRKKEKDELDNKRNETDDMSRRAKDQADLFAKQILDSDFKKANELQPTVMVVNFTTLDDDNKTIIDRKSFVAGVKSRMLGAGAVDIIERLVSKEKTSLSFRNLLKATTGEISFFKDFILAVKQNKMNAKNAAKKGSSAQMWNLLEKRSTANAYKKMKKDSNSAAAITTLVINQETVDYMKATYKFDLGEIKNVRLIMDSYNLLGIVIADEVNEVAKFIYDGNDQFELVSYSSLSRDAADKNYKKIVNLVNKAGR